MLKFQDGVSLSDLDVGMFKCVDICNTVYNDQGVDCTVTASGKQYINLRSWHINDKEAIAINLSRSLGKDFDVMVEKNHIHIENNTIIKRRKK